ncbi:hypothetical protein BGZ82_005424 [Podila clonocystis]|nr:hypothetical protein BGZ82_005424 [Podila clonocystis]
MNTLHELESPYSPQDTPTSKSPKHRRRHEPVVIHTINPALGPLSSRALNRAGTMSPMTPSTPFSSHPSRPRADSTAARIAAEVTEAMIQERLDQLTRRLDTFNEQSFDLYTRTQQLAAEFQAKSKRLYQVEDHLLKIQGKPGLSDDFLAHGPQPRRLTNDLEELRMGVKTLRKKFQMAGSVVATVGWWQHLKQSSSDEPSPGPGKPLTPMRTFSKKEKLPLEKIFTDSIPEAISELSPNEPRHLHASAVYEVSPVLGLRSPPLTPKGPLSGSSLLVGLSLESKGDMSVLPVIPDHDNEVASPTTVIMATPSFSHEDVVLEKTPRTAIADETKGIGFAEEEPPVPVPAFLSAFAPPSPPYPSPVSVLSEEIDAVETAKESEPELNEPNSASENAHPTQEDSKDEEEMAIQESEEHGLKSMSSSVSSPEVKPELTSLIEVTELSDVEEASFAEMDAKDHVEDQDTVDQDRSVDKDTQDKPSIDAFTATSNPVQEVPDTWVQAFWRFLIRIEYFVLGTAVLGAMMPDNAYALCAGFFSALVYASLLIYHRVAASPGSEAPKPPTGTRRRVIVVSPGGSQSRRSSRYQASLNSASIKAE